MLEMAGCAPKSTTGRSISRKIYTLFKTHLKESSSAGVEGWPYLLQGGRLLVLQGRAGGERLQAPREDAVHSQVVGGRRDGAVRGRHLGQLALQELEDYINV